MTAPARVDVRHLSSVEVSAILRRELKAAFPATRFSVRTARGGSVHVSWTDGPTAKRVRDLTNRFQGKDFDGMADMSVYRGAFEYNGERVSTYCFVFENRELSARFVELVAGAIASYFGLTAPAIVAGWVKPTSEQDRECTRATGYDWGTMVHQAAGDHTRVMPMERRLALVV